MTTETQNPNKRNNNSRPLRQGRTNAFKAFRALRMMRPDQAANHLSAVPERFHTSAAIAQLRQVHPE